MEKVLEGSAEVQPQREGEKGGGGVESDGEDGNEDVDVKVKVIEWEEFQDSLAHLFGLAAHLTKERVKREALSHQLETALEVRKQSLKRVDALEAMQRQLQAKQRSLDIAKTACAASKQDLVRVRDNLVPSAQALHISFKVMADAQGRLKDAGRMLAGVGGHGRLLKLHKALDARRRIMVAQVAALYPVTICSSSSGKQKCGEKSSSTAESTSMAIAGLQLLEPGKKQPGLFNDKQENDTTATALGYVAHVVAMVAGYLDVPLRYPVRLGVSHSYIQDYSPAIEPPPSVDIVAPVGTAPVERTVVEFPLFSEGQDQTRSAYAVFLLNKDLEQILNQLGVESVGPRHTLLNLNRLISTVCSGDHVIS
ncbi:unnamed protein product [Sphagnum troendelagicum]|uniref:UV radiation resistance-associated gene protein n=1 Tax=Sphagnum troendelagicum TaxID=128251 RepID=A0ABP0U0Y2_9BRYO